MEGLLVGKRIDAVLLKGTPPASVREIMTPLSRRRMRCSASISRCEKVRKDNKEKSGSKKKTYVRYSMTSCVRLLAEHLLIKTPTRQKSKMKKSHPK